MSTAAGAATSRPATAEGERTVPARGERTVAAGLVEVRVAVRPPFPYRLPRRNGMDGVLRSRRGVIHRLLHDDEGRPVVVRAAEAGEDVLFGARAPTPGAARWGIGRMRFALGVDDDLSDLHVRFRRDPDIGPILRADPGWRPVRRPDPFEALIWAITEQLIETARAAQIQRRIVWRFGRTDGDLRDVPSAKRLSQVSRAQLQACDLGGSRATALLRAAGEVAAGRVDWDDDEHALRRLRAIPGIGSWTCALTALLGQGRPDACPAGDLHLRRFVGRGELADEADVLAYFARYEEWAGYAGLCALRTLGRSPRPIPAPAGTRWSARRPGPVAA